MWLGSDPGLASALPRAPPSASSVSVSLSED